MTFETFVNYLDESRTKALGNQMMPSVRRQCTLRIVLVVMGSSTVEPRNQRVTLLPATSLQTVFTNFIHEVLRQKMESRVVRLLSSHISFVKVSSSQSLQPHQQPVNNGLRYRPMSHLLWKYYWENDVDRFRRLLAPGGFTSHASAAKSTAIGSGGSSPGGLGTSPRNAYKNRRPQAFSSASTRSRDGGSSLGRSDVNSRDHAGLTLLLRAASSTDTRAIEFVQALAEHPSIDLYVQDPESGWNALHRALYSGNASIARLLLASERGALVNCAPQSLVKVGQLFKMKDHEGNSPFDLYNLTVSKTVCETVLESLRLCPRPEDSDSNDEVMQIGIKPSGSMKPSAEGGELYVFGSNKNVSLGLLDDDYKVPKRIPLQRPNGLLHHLHKLSIDGQVTDCSSSSPDIDSIPNLVRDKPIVIQEVAMSKLHSAVLTTDPVSNLYMCGVGRGGRLGLGHENTQFKFLPVQGPFADRKILKVALGQNHTLFLTDNGELWTCGLNSDAQLGYALPPPARTDEEPVSLTPRQVFGALKKEVVIGVAASAIHSVAHTGSSLYCWGRNAGQLAVVDSDSRSLDLQQTPRRVAASLLSAPIEMVSAIDKATTCLLSNYTVWVFTNYGYNLVKFPIPVILRNHDLVARSFSSRLNPGWKKIRYITSGGETIAAVTSRGDLFTMQINHQKDDSQPAGSTTNPVKMRSAVTQPKCIWNSRKDGVSSVSVGENGSVILCTKSGAVWKRVKRQSVQVAGFSSSGIEKNDFKFERVPYLTDCVNVRSSVFGAFAAVRRDKSNMSDSIGIENPSLWADMACLCCLHDFKPSEPFSDMDQPDMWNASDMRGRIGCLSFEILRSLDVERDISPYCFQRGDLDVGIRTTAAPNIMIPVHGFVLASRSRVLREAFCAFRRGTISTSHSDTFQLESDNDKLVVTFSGVDIYTILNVVVFAYQDDILAGWLYARSARNRFRQVRSEVMKLATKLQMPQLEAVARLQTGRKRSLGADMLEAISDPAFFDDGDVSVQLRDGDVIVHSQLMCQRCPFFKGMFQGRSQGQWLSQRRSESPASEPVRINLEHIDLDTFHYVLRYLYADVGEEMFDEVTMPTIDDFSEIVLNVMSAANELMLDRLSQICQSVIGRFVNTRNICNLLNEISPCSVTEFKDAGLKFITFQLECMLENQLLDCLDEELLRDLDQVVRHAQLERCPVPRSGRAELLLHKNYPDLVMDIDEERRRRVREMAFKLTHKDEEKRLSSLHKARVGSLDDVLSAPPPAERICTTPKASRSEQDSPTLRSKQSQGDMIFSMDEEVTFGATSPLSSMPSVSGSRQHIDLENMQQLPEAWRSGTGKEPAEKGKTSSLSPCWTHGTERVSGEVALETNVPSRKPSGPWASPALSGSRVDLRDIMSEASSKPGLRSGLATRISKSPSFSRPPVKMSQKERKKHLQMQAEAATQVGAPLQASGDPELAAGSRSQPWKVVGVASKASLSETTLSAEPVAAVVKKPTAVAAEARPYLNPRRTGSPDTRFSGQGRMSCSAASAAVPGPVGPSKKETLVPHSRSYMTAAPKASPSFGASMADIIGQQKREQELAKEAVAKRSLQEIQQEQAFQEWWDLESRRAQEDEAKRQAKLQDPGSETTHRSGRRDKARATEATGTGGGGESSRHGGKGQERGKGKGKGAKGGKA
ncbi:hypothetical protein L249_3324 [Ophiocordyceps polyrhachis-furcata BCC 54312]|uniref:BTB domain-containing protein n=1 Tax=Ophiocordyceps polyrhachis-furcata BCC 54312 TaxID=1330021 RepID=A0A367LMS0_9HYPO|nr:hypothetical protein L249_3324 [Ophiocordyceps polyrhachis-furcata BCC 54312]